MSKVTSVLSVCWLAAVAFGRHPPKHVQDGIYLDVKQKSKDSRQESLVRQEGRQEKVAKEPTLKRAVVDLKPSKINHTVVDSFIVPMSAIQVDQNTICEDVAAEHTGFDVNDDNGFLKHASCDDLEAHCHDESIGEQVRVSCPVSCFLCTAGKGGEADTWHGKCFDAVNTGIRFREGPKATCSDLINYCNHTSIGQQVKEACKLSCGLCMLHVEGPYLDAYGNCEDLASHEEPEFTVAGSLAGCSDMAQFCQNHPDSYLIRHKCPLTCGVCGNLGPTTEAPESNEVQIPGDTGGCSRRRRWGFCSTRRRRNI